MAHPAETWSYLHPAGVMAVTAAGLPALTTMQGGKVIVDRRILELWRAAAGRSFAELLAWGASAGWQKAELAGATAALRAAGLLARLGVPPETQDRHPTPAASAEGRVSVVLVAYNSREWLPGCFESLRLQTCPPHEIIVVDNGSTDGSAEWVEGAEPHARVLRLPAGGSLAAALNAGMQIANGDYFLLLNPDVVLDGRAVESMLAVAQSDPRCAAVAAKLRLLWAPSFLNGLGNSVGALAYGTDSALGHLDLGQFDAWDEVPSACFAAALLSAAAVTAGGLLDEGFPMYYEDVEWCYRLRLLGWRVRSAPAANVYHAFSGRRPGDEPRGLPADKLRRVTYGRLRFIHLLFEERTLRRVRRRYRLEDLAGMAFARLRADRERVEAYRSAWDAYRRQSAELESRRLEIQAGRLISDAALFAVQRPIPEPLVRNGLPLLTVDVLRRYTLPWLLGPGGGHFPETAALDAAYIAPSGLRRLIDIRRSEGLSALAHRIAKELQWKLRADL